MKRLIATFGGLLPTLALAQQGFLGTRAGGASTYTGANSSPVGVGSVAQIAIALGVVLLLVRYVLPKALTKVNKKLVTSLQGGIQIEESASFAGGNLYVVRARSKTLLLSVATSGVTCLADLSEPQTPVHEVPTFHEMLQAAPGEAPIPDVRLDESDDPLTAALARLDRLDRFTQS